MALTDMTIVRKSLLSRLFSTSTTVLTVAVAVALMLVLVSMRDAARQTFDRGSGNMHLLISRDSSPLMSVLNGVFYAGAPARPIEWRKYEEVSARLPFAFAIPTQLGDSLQGFPVMATTPEFFTHFSSDPSFDPVTATGDAPAWQFAAGRPFERPFEIVVGARVAEALNLSVGSHVHVAHGMGLEAHAHDHFDYDVVGILELTGTPHDRAVFSDLESTWQIHAHDRAVRDGTPDEVLESDRLITGIYARVLTRPGASASSVLPSVFYQLRADPSLTVAGPSEEIGKLFRIVSNIDIILVAMAGVVMVSSGIAIMLALYNTMEQRRRQIAVLRVLGCSRMRIFGLVLTESAMVGLFGAIAGTALALLGAFAVAEALRINTGLHIDAKLEPSWILIVGVGTMALAALAGLAPAVAAYRTSVARNLRPLG